MPATLVGRELNQSLLLTFPIGPSFEHVELWQTEDGNLGGRFMSLTEIMPVTVMSK